jgi:hypothetical protein
MSSSLVASGDDVRRLSSALVASGEADVVVIVEVVGVFGIVRSVETQSQKSS